MKASASVLVGAVLVTSGWVAVPAVAFPNLDQATASPQRARAAVASASTEPAQEGACRADTHAHSASCGCARCAGARND